MGPGVGAGLVEADSADNAVGVRLELDAHLDRCRVARVLDHGGDIGSPDRARAVHADRDARSRLLQVAAVVDRPGLDRRRGIPMCDPRITPGHRGVRRRHRGDRMPGRAAVGRDLNTRDHTAARIGCGAGDGGQRAVLQGRTLRRRCDR